MSASGKARSSAPEAMLSTEEMPPLGGAGAAARLFETQLFVTPVVVRGR